ncbi:putative protein TPRXL isoform X2 [Dendroctonus ponderosae]|uniref:Uncharacterized protein n=1 Tax=Dendroctonus ponderosae TaxID=77166 RepID=A0AAR5PYG9_DENPD|nr:putative protein TPRXL isoform X2 [Dendroctonus ponderosae]
MFRHGFCVVASVLLITFVFSTKASPLSISAGSSSVPLPIHPQLNDSDLKSSTTYPSSSSPSSPTASSTYLDNTSSDLSSSTDYSTSSTPVTDDPTTSSSRPAYTPFSVSVVSKNVPSDLYTYTAVGILQLCLEEESSFNQALVNFQQLFQNKYLTETWKLATGCSLMILPNNVTYIKLFEQYTQTQIMIFV